MVRAVKQFIEEQRTPEVLVCSSLSIESPLYAYIRAELNEPSTTINAVTPTQILEQQRRYPLSVMLGCFEQCPRNDTQVYLGHLKNVLSESVFCIVDAKNSEWRHSDFLAMGMKRDQHFDLLGETYDLYAYHLTTYQRKKDWNSPKNWANPENWGKYRW